MIGYTVQGEVQDGDACDRGREFMKTDLSGSEGTAIRQVRFGPL